MILNSYATEKDFFSGNTVIGCLITNARLSKAETSRLAGRGQDAIAKTVHPAHSIYDGDTVFALCSGQTETSIDAVGILAEYAASAAIVDAVKSARSYKHYLAFREIEKMDHS